MPESDDAPDSNPTARPLYAAHTPNDAGRWQSMQEHVGEVTRLAEVFAGAFGMDEWGRWAGLLHDIGKYSDEFQKKLSDCHSAKAAGRPEPRERVDHKSAGAWLSSQEIKNDPLGMALFGHHGGLPSVSGLVDALKKAVELPHLRATIDRAIAEYPTITAPPKFEPPYWVQPRSAKRERELFIRMVYSCLVDADSLDTEAHFSAGKAGLRGDETRLEVYRDLLQEDQTTLMEEASDTAVNRVRRQVYEACLSSAALPPGVFRLTVPTGGGKTRSSLAFALEHALHNDMDRVIYAIPYTSIIDQTVDEFRKVFGLGAEAPRVLEHHSAIPEPAHENADDADIVEGMDLWRRLASENWDARLVVTTTVQLFESLFSRKPGRCRKVHRLARSVIVLDEVQTLPAPLLAPIVDALKDLAAHYGTTVVLCTATQPALNDSSGFLKGFANVREIVPTEIRNEHFRRLQRVEYRIEREPWSWARVAVEMADSAQCLTVVNTRKDALALLDALEELGVEDRLHLSTLLCGKHRRNIIRDVKERLRLGQAVRLVSTQVVEAGVDLDFPQVMRAVGPLDRIIQAAGRCNREGKRESGLVIVFTPEEGGSPRGPYATALAEARIFLAREEIDLHDPEIIERYFRSLFSLIDTDEHRINGYREALDFPGVAEKFRMIEDNTIPILSPYDERIFNEVIDEAEARGRMTRDLWRKAQPLMVAVQPQDVAEKKRSIIQEIIPEQLYVWRGEYDGIRGLVGTARTDTIY